MMGYFSKSRKSALLRCPSRWGSPVLRVETSRVASMEERDASVVCSVRSPVMPLMVPFTFAIIMCLTLNSAAVWAGSIFHVMREAGAETDAMEAPFVCLGAGEIFTATDILPAGSVWFVQLRLVSRNWCEVILAPCLPVDHHFPRFLGRVLEFASRARARPVHFPCGLSVIRTSRRETSR